MNPAPAQNISHFPIWTFCYFFSELAAFPFYTGKIIKNFKSINISC